MSRNRRISAKIACEDACEFRNKTCERVARGEEHGSINTTSHAVFAGPYGPKQQLVRVASAPTVPSQQLGRPCRPKRTGVHQCRRADCPECSATAGELPYGFRGTDSAWYCSFTVCLVDFDLFLVARHLGSLNITAAPPSYVQPSYYSSQPHPSYLGAPSTHRPPQYTDYNQQLSYLSAPQPPSQQRGYWEEARDTSVRHLNEQANAYVRFQGAYS